MALFDSLLVVDWTSFFWSKLVHLKVGVDLNRAPQLGTYAAVVVSGITAFADYLQVICKVVSPAGTIALRVECF